MNEVLAISLRGMQADMSKVEQVGMNLANALTAGYKRGLALQGPVGAGFAAHLAGLPATAQPDEAAAVTLRTDLRPGTLKFTGQKLDLALAGGGYFEVLTPQGPAYTRQGSFHLDAQGRIVTPQGYPVMGTAGEIVLAGTDPVISPTGVVTAPGSETPMAEIKVVEFEADATLERAGDGLVTSAGRVVVLGREGKQVRQGFLEDSNVSPVQEMTQLIRAMRHFESLQKVAQGYDEMLGVAIRKLGET